MPIRDQLAEFCFNLKYEDLPPDVVEFTRLLLMDQAGETIAGVEGHRAEGHVDLGKFIRGLGGKRESSLVGQACKGTTLNAAFLNTAASYGGFDGLHRSAVHLPASLIPAAIAVAERQKASGQDLILATVTGAEIFARVAWALGADGAYKRGFHPTSLCAPFGVAAAAGKLLGLGQEAMGEALSIAGVQGAGARPWPQAPKSPQTAWIQVGKAAQSGVFAALLAQMGLPGIRNILEDSQGFLAGHSARSDPSKLTENLGKVWEVKQITLKRFGVGIYVIPGMEALIDIQQKHKVRPGDIAGMTYRLPTAVIPLVGSPDYPWTGSSKNSRYLLAVTAYKGEDGMSFNRDYTSEADLNDPRHQALFKLIDVVGDPELDRYFPGKWPCILTVKTRDGREFSQFHDQPAKGEPENPFTEREIEARFQKGVKPILGPDRCQEMLGIFRRLAHVTDVSRLAELMAST